MRNYSSRQDQASWFYKVTRARRYLCSPGSDCLTDIHRALVLLEIQLPDHVSQSLSVWRKRFISSYFTYQDSGNDSQVMESKEKKLLTVCCLGEAGIMQLKLQLAKNDVCILDCLAPSIMCLEYFRKYPQVSECSEVMYCIFVVKLFFKAKRHAKAVTKLENDIKDVCTTHNFPSSFPCACINTLGSILDETDVYFEHISLFEKAIVLFKDTSSYLLSHLLIALCNLYLFLGEKDCVQRIAHHAANMINSESLSVKHFGKLLLNSAEKESMLGGTVGSDERTTESVIEIFGIPPAIVVSSLLADRYRKDGNFFMAVKHANRVLDSLEYVKVKVMESSAEVSYAFLPGTRISGYMQLILMVMYDAITIKEGSNQSMEFTDMHKSLQHFGDISDIFFPEISSNLGAILRAFFRSVVNILLAKVSTCQINVEDSTSVLLDISEKALDLHLLWMKARTDYILSKELKNVAISNKFQKQSSNMFTYLGAYGYINKSGKYISPINKIISSGGMFTNGEPNDLVSESDVEVRQVCHIEDLT